MTAEMRQKYFNVYIEFDHDRFEQTVFDTIERGEAGYVCAVESNNLTIANLNPEFLDVLNGALVNHCDGSVLAKILAHIHKKNIDSYIAHDVFNRIVKMKRFRQFFLGNTPEVLAGLKDNMLKLDPAVASMRFETLPFRSVDCFDYPAIAEMINADSPDIIWVSLGAPKQEMFMARLKPYLKKGVMFGYGAVFNFCSGVGPVKRAPKWMLSKRLEWLHRAIEEPRKNVPRYWRFVKILPGLIREEKRKVRAERGKSK